MKFSERWLREWVNPAISSEQLQKQLTMAGLEIEATEPVAAVFSNVVVGEVLSVTKHPDADKLNVCVVNDGNEQLQVVCGAANVRAGLKVPFAKIGAKLSTELTIKRAKLRGVESNGMLCSAAELGLVDSADGLLELPASAPVGNDIRDYLGLDDLSIEVNLTPNRGDCLSIAGLAREVGVLTKATVTGSTIAAIPAVINDHLAISLQAPTACPRYLGRVIRNINPDAESPLWLQEKLRRCGLRSIDPVVDVTNYVLLELGQPMHAFDYQQLTGSIQVRMAKPGEQLTLLDGKTVELAPDTLVIADEKSALAMAGVMGGKASAVGARTTDIFLESAFFAPLAIAGRARKLGMHTDAGHRYERGVDFNLPARAMERATALLLEIVGGQPGPVITAEAELVGPAPITLRKARIASLLGMCIADADVEDILARLGFELQTKDQSQWMYAVPSWRFDISIEVDLIEELARVLGYDQLPVTAPAARVSLQPQGEAQKALRSFRRHLVALGYQEVVTYSFVDPELEAALGGGTQALPLANPISQDMSVMRTNLWSGLLSTLKHNQNRQQNRLRLFESGLSFSFNNNKLEQKLKVACLLWGAVRPEQWAAASESVDFFDIKGDLESLLGGKQLNGTLSFTAGSHPALHPGQTAELWFGSERAGCIGALHPVLQQVLDIPGKVFLAEIDFAVARQQIIPTVSELSRFPTVRRDLALVVEETIPAEAVLSELKTIAGAELQDIVIFDLYQGQHIEKGKKSLALGLTFQHASRTLADSDINPIIDNCIKALQAKFNAELR
jgi:phenylalanyl-tRNA synthetase beta chain